jgi:hypothetical protein
MEVSCFLAHSRFTPSIRCSRLTSPFGQSIVPSRPLIEVTSSRPVLFWSTPCSHRRTILTDSSSPESGARWSLRACVVILTIFLFANIAPLSVVVRSVSGVRLVQSSCIQLAVRMLAFPCWLILSVSLVVSTVIRKYLAAESGALGRKPRAVHVIFACSDDCFWLFSALRYIFWAQPG